MKVAVLTLTTYPSRHIVTALHSMPLFRIPLSKNRRIQFFKLLGSGRGASFNFRPNWKQYGIFTVSESQDVFPFIHHRYDNWKRNYYGRFISSWWNFCGCETWTIILEPVFSNGSWSGVDLFNLTDKKDFDGPVAVLTRATIRPSRVGEFWRNVKTVQASMENAPGLVFSLGIGEMPFLKQGTFSIWKTEDQMKAFAYNMQQHREVIFKTRSRQWYSEEMFTRFKLIAQAGKLNGRSPLPIDFIPTLSHL